MEYCPSPPSAPAPEKSCQILIREYPHRAIAIVSQTHALILRHSQSTSDAIAAASLPSVASARSRLSSCEKHASKCMVEFAAWTDELAAEYRPLAPRPIFGTLGLISIGRNVFLCIITLASRVATLRPGETVERIEGVQFVCLSTAEYDDVVAIDPYEVESDASSAFGQNLGRRDAPVEHPCQELRKLLSNGTFYYSTDFDITNRMQDRPADAMAFNIDHFDESFLWNSYMIRPLVEFRFRLQGRDQAKLDKSRILTCAMRGFCKTWPIPQAIAPLRTRKTGLPSYLTVVSRLSCMRAGTRFNSRGIDDDGNVANFVETETIYWSPTGVVFSYAQVRGSVPIFWEQVAALVPNQQKITITRSSEGTQPAFNKHFKKLENAYGAVHVVNLLSPSKPSEADLMRGFHQAIAQCPLAQAGDKASLDHALLRESKYDFHAETREGYEAAQGIRRHLEGSVDGFAYYLAEESGEAGDGVSGRRSGRRYVVVLQQEGVFRTNCLDCLDRTNVIQGVISQIAVESFLNHRGQKASPDFWTRHADLWADNGDSLSKSYAGTGALKSSFTRRGKMSLAGALDDMKKSATRLFHNNFTDKGRQTTIDTLLGRLVGQMPVVLYDPISDSVAVELQKRRHEFCSAERINIWVGTFNVNGRTEGIDQDLSPWLCRPGDTLPEIVAIGFQEIVELSPQQIMNSDPSRRHLWETAAKRTLDRRAQRIGGDRYVLLRSGQLVGAALCVFVKAAVLHHVKNVEGGVRKTGLSGIAGNKGAVAIRLDYANTPICFVTAHLAAGFDNYDERNKDYATINSGLRFQRNRAIDDHESVVWFGDFNYRIGLSLEETKELIKQRNLARLYDNDQLNLQMVSGLAFRFYSEARITFMPTYKFDIGSDVYDSSDKARIPAWTDRILRKGANLRQVAYGSAPLRFSDHRPVYAAFECTVNIVNEPLREGISHAIYERRKMELGNRTANLDTIETDDEDIVGYDAIEPGMPPASSDRHKWWLEGGQMAKSSVRPPKPPKPGMQTVLNPKRPTNPYVPTDEPDWVNVPRSESRLSSFSSISTSPYEHVHPSMLLSTSASSSAPRKLPPPPDKCSRTKEDQSQVDGPPPLPPLRTQTAAPSSTTTSAAVPLPCLSSTRVPPRAPIPSIASNPLPPPSRSGSPAPPSLMNSTASAPLPRLAGTKSKPAPPVAKKPAHLSGQAPARAEQEADVSLNESVHRPITGYDGNRAEAPSPADRIQAQPHAQGVLGIHQKDAPTLPPRRAGTAHTRLHAISRHAVPATEVRSVIAAPTTPEARPNLPWRNLSSGSIASITNGFSESAIARAIAEHHRRHPAAMNSGRAATESQVRQPSAATAATQHGDLLDDIDDDVGLTAAGLDMSAWGVLKPSQHSGHESKAY